MRITSLGEFVLSMPDDQQSGSSPANATSRISGPAGRSSQRRKASHSRLRSRKANAAITSRL